MKACQFTEPVTYHGEGAVWSEVWNGLRCLDMFEGDILHFDGDGRHTRHHLGSGVAMIRPIRPGMSLVARRDDIVVWDEVANSQEVIAEDLVGPDTRLNEGTCAPDGSLLIGTMSLGAAAPTARLLQIVDGRVSLVAGDITVSNGVGYCPDGTRVYYVDSSTRRVDVFSVTENGALVDRRPLTEIAEGAGFPDGLCVDADGGIWVALYGGSAVHRYLPDGTFDGAITVSARQVTSCTFGGHDLRTLYITTSRENLGPGDDPQAGSLFCVRPGLAGLPTHPYRTPDSAAAGLD